MRRVNLMCLAAVLLTAGFATANTVWNPTEPNDVAAGYSNWTKASNWTAGLPGLGTEVPPLDPKAVFNVAGRPECIVDSAVSCQTLAMGDNGALTGNFLRVVDGGSLILVKADWNAIGYNRSSTLTVEKGGYAETGRQLFVGRDGDGDTGTGTVGQYPSYLILNGGTVVIKQDLLLGNNDANKNQGGGIVNLNSGLLDIRGNLQMNNQAVSRVDIKYGTLIINGDRRTNLTNWTTGASTPGNAKIVTGFGGTGTVVFDYNVRNAGKTTVTAVGPMAPSPAYGSTVAEGTVALGWTNMDPNKPGDPVYVDVWFGTDPNKLSLAYSQVVAAGMNTTTVNVTAPVIGTPPTTYYWQVDSYIYGSPAGTPIESDVFQFDVTNDFPPTVVIDTPNTVTWNGQPVQMDATVSDTGSSALTITWSANNPNAVFSDASVEDPVVTISNLTAFPTTVVLTCSVKDALNSQTNTATRNVVVYADACLAARVGAGLAAAYQMDLAEPYCVINMADLAVIAADWLIDYTLLAPTVIP